MSNSRCYKSQELWIHCRIIPVQWSTVSIYITRNIQNPKSGQCPCIALQLKQRTQIEPLALDDPMYDTATARHCRTQEKRSRHHSQRNIMSMSLYQPMQPKYNTKMCLFVARIPTSSVSSSSPVQILRDFTSCRKRGRTSNRRCARRRRNGCVGSTCPFVLRRFRGAVGATSRGTSIQVWCLVGRRGCVSLFPWFQISKCTLQ